MNSPLQTESVDVLLFSVQSDVVVATLQPRAKLWRMGGDQLQSWIASGKVEER